MSIIPYTNNLRQSCTQAPTFSQPTIAKGNYEFWSSMTGELDMKLSECNCSQMITELSGDIPTHINYNSIENIVNNYVNKYRRTLSKEYIPYFLQNSTLDYEVKQEASIYLDRYI